MPCSMVKDLGPGVITGNKLKLLFDDALKNNYAIPSFNVTSTSTVNAALEAAGKFKVPVIIQFSHGGGAFFVGKSLPNKNYEASILGSVLGAHYIRGAAKAYNATVVVHSDHCPKEALPWVDGMLEADEEYFKQHGEPLFSSHMLDLSKEPKEENIKICLDYLKRMSKLNCLLEMEIGITGGEEDGVNNESVENSRLYTQPADIWDVYSTLSQVSPMFTIAAAFGNVHGVYKPGNVKLHPELLAKHQEYVRKMSGANTTKPVYFVFHGGSGSSAPEINTAVDGGVVKMNIDTDTQWAYWEGVMKFYNTNKDYLQGQVGNPKGDDKPNKSYYDPRVWLREAEKSFVTRAELAYKCLGTL